MNLSELRQMIREEIKEISFIKKRIQDVLKSLNSKEFLCIVIIAHRKSFARRKWIEDNEKSLKPEFKITTKDFDNIVKTKLIKTGLLRGNGGLASKDIYKYINDEQKRRFPKYSTQDFSWATDEENKE
jgi:hypothetical protein